MGRTQTMLERRAEILAATVRVLARDGIAETTTRKIASEAGVNQATLRYYFGSKDELLFAVLQEMMRMTNEIVRSGMSTSSDLRTAIREGISTFWSHVEKEPELQQIQFELTLYALRNRDSAWLAKQQYDGYQSVVEELFRQHFERNGLKEIVPFAEIARFVIIGLDGLMLQFFNDHNKEQARGDLENLIMAVTELASKGQEL